MHANADLLDDIQAQKALMIAVATGGPRIQEKNQDYQERRLRIKGGLLRKQIDDPNPYGDLWEWYGKWSSGDLPTYQSRRQYIGRLYQPLVDKLTLEGYNGISEPALEQTGWAKVDRGVDALRARLETADTPEEFQTVGLLCRETIISLAQAVYNPLCHASTDGIDPSATDAYRMLEAYFSNELKGMSHEALRRHARASLQLANDLQHRRTAEFSNAALCAEATRTVVNIVAIISGKRDPDNREQAINPETTEDIPF